MSASLQPQSAPMKPTWRDKIVMRQDRITAFLMLLPSIILLAIFVYGFIGQTGWTSLTDWEGLAENPEVTFIGTENYNTLFTGFIPGIRFRQGLVNNLFFTVFFLAGCLGMGIFLAILLDQNIKGESIFRTIFMFPMALSFIVTGTIWRWLYNPNGGINKLPELIGLPALNFSWLTNRDSIWNFNWENMPEIITGIVIVVLLYLVFRKYIGEIIQWLLSLRKQNAGVERQSFVGYWGELPNSRRGMIIVAAVLLVWMLLGGTNWIPTPGREELHGFNLAFIGIILAAVWQMSGYTMAMYLAGLRGIPEELREAARVDGCTEFQVYRYIIFPLLQPITLSAMIILGHISLKIFDLIFAMSGADNLTTDVPGILMYLTSFRSNQFAMGASIAMVMLIMVAFVIVPYLWTTLRSETEL